MNPDGGGHWRTAVGSFGQKPSCVYSSAPPLPTASVLFISPYNGRWCAIEPPRAHR
jgi:hypothetical protein